MQYRKDIDLLRAISVIAVLFYHASVQPFNGGFVGVDVFFVISGFLISSIVSQQIINGTFSLPKFYINRFFRLFPALLFVVFGSLIAGYFILSPLHYEPLGGSSVHAIFSLSNFYFWAQVDYWDISKYFKPLLHTWSLGVEEQFYFFWPLFLIAALGFSKESKVFLGALLVMFVCSLSLSIHWSSNEETAATAFFLLPARVFEFCLGAMLVKFKPSKPLNSWLSDVLFLGGLAVMIGSIIWITEAFAFPGYIALVPCLGAVLCILSGASSRLANVLSQKIILYIGKISYSLYLVHWPIIVFYKYKNFGSLDTTGTVIVLVSSLVAAMALYHLIETPFRGRGNKINFSRALSGSIALGLMATCVVTSANIWAKSGWDWRVDEEMSAVMKEAQKDLYARQDVIRAPLCHYRTASETFEEYISRFDQCNTIAPGSILIIGDSHAADVYGALSLNLKDVNLIQLTRASCAITSSYRTADGKCAKLLRYAQDLAIENAEDIKQVIFKSRGAPYHKQKNGEFESLKLNQMNMVGEYLGELEKNGIRTLWLGPNTEIDGNFLQILAASFNAKNAENTARSLLKVEEIEAFDEAAQKIADKIGITYLSTKEVCNGLCPLLTDEDKAIVPDYGHWGAEGARYMGQKLVNSQKFRQ